MQTDLIDEARRQAEICNACRYCEGYCAVFPALHRERSFGDADIIHLANLCHTCRGCYYACQYTAPHAFNLNLPRALAAPGGAKAFEIGVRPEFVSFADDGIPVEIVKVSDVGRYSVVDTRHDGASIKVLAPEGMAVPAERAHIRFDPTHTQVYADGWMLSESGAP